MGGFPFVRVEADPISNGAPKAVVPGHPAVTRMQTFAQLWR